MRLADLAVVFIGTNKYLNFLPSWYESCEEYLLPGHEKQYFVFTDGELDELPDNISLYHQEHLPWPYITLYRFSTILKAYEDICKYDYLLFLDADMRLVDTVKAEEILTGKPYIGVHHPCHFLGMNPHTKFPGAFETNSDSSACITDEDDTTTYFQGCLWGGKVPDVIDMMKELQKRTEDDLSRNVIAVWHDESHLNKFYSERVDDVHILSPSFAYPELFSEYCNFEPKIVHLAKENSKYHQ